MSMNEQELFQKSFSNLHASDNTLYEVMRKVNSGSSMKGISKRFVALVAALVMLFSMAIVVHSTGILADIIAILTPVEDPQQVIEQAFGDKISTEKPDMKDAYGNPLDMPDMERPSPDLTETEKLIGAYISDVDGVLTVGENTFTLKSFLVDEKGSGTITWTVENPNGIEYGDAGYGMVYFAPMAPFDEPRISHYGVDTPKDKGISSRTVLVSENESRTTLGFATYFGTFSEYQQGDSFVWAVSINGKQETKSIQITPAQHIPVKVLEESRGKQLLLANLSLTLDHNSNIESIPGKIVIYFKDGTEYCLQSGDRTVHNVSAGFWRSNESYSYDELVLMFNRIIDVDEVACVEMECSWLEVAEEGIDATNIENYRRHENYMFYP